MTTKSEKDAPVIDLRVYTNKNLPPARISYLLRQLADLYGVEQQTLQLMGGHLKNESGDWDGVWNVTQIARSKLTTYSDDNYNLNAMREALSESDLLKLTDILASRVVALEAKLAGARQEFNTRPRGEETRDFLERIEEALS